MGRKKKQSKMLNILLGKRNKKSNGFRKYDEGKLRYDLMPARVLEEVVDILTIGAKKYTVGNSSGDNNWMKCPDINNRYYAAAMRHIQAWRKGEILDPETNKHHLAHAICNLTFLIESANIEKDTFRKNLEWQNEIKK